MRAWMAVASLAVMAAGATGCQTSAFACQSDGACPEGRCEPQGWCSFPDTSCGSGYRFGDHAAQGLAGTCVDVTEDGTESATTTGPPNTTGLPATTGSSTTAALDDSGTIDADASSSDGSTAAGTSTSAETTGGADTTGSTTGGQVSVVTIQIASDADDGAMYFDDTMLVWVPSGETGDGDGFFGEYPAGEYYVAYFRFALPPEVDSSLLIDARLRLTATRTLTYMWNPKAHAVGVWLEADRNAPQVSSGSAFPAPLGGFADGTALTGSYVRWPDEGGLTWILGENVSPDISTLFNELELQVGELTSGAHVQLWLAVADPIGTGGEVTYVDYAAGNGDAPQLELTFQDP